MSAFDSKIFNPNVFMNYYDTLASDFTVRLVTSGVLVNNPALGSILPDQTGGNYITRPLKGRLTGTPVIYDGATDITTGALATYSQGIVVIGRAEAFTEKDFTQSITGHDFMTDVAIQLRAFWDEVNEKLLLSILKGVFATALAGNKFDPEDTISATDLADAMTKVSGDRQSHFVFAFMHSAVANELAKLQLLNYIKYTDTQGIQRDTNLAQWFGRTVLVTDEVPFEKIYELTSDTDIVAGKTYYTRSGSAGAYVYTPVASPVKANLNTYYEYKYTNYTTYVLGRGSIEYANCGVKVPVEMSRNALENGGEDTLVSRERIILAPYGLTFKVSGMSSLTPTNAELETGSAWELVKDPSANTINPKHIPLLALVSRV